MPVRDRSGEPEPKRCKHCDESTHSSAAEESGGSWRVTLDRDLVETLSAIYPEWFLPQHQQQQLQSLPRAMAGAAPSPAAPPAPPPPPPPPPTVSCHSAHSSHVTVDATPLQQAMDKNKESLKVKLMLRRPLNQLVAQGIMPPLKTPPAFHEQRKQLERAKTGDLLKAKIQKRPDRQELERRHILQQQEGHVDPSLAEKQRMLKKARLADQLNDQLSHRPGPLELIQKNILHTDEPIERAVKEGLVPFKATCEGALRRPEHPSSYQGPDEDSPAEEGSPPMQLSLSPPAALVVTSAPVHFHAVLPPPAISLVDLCHTTLLPLAPSPVSVTSSTSTLSPLSSAASPPAPITPRPAPSPLLVSQAHSQRSDAPGKDKNRKKSKSKAAPKARTIKFHEYKGPPNAHKSSSPPGMMAQGETSYELLLRQQQLFLQWQLEWQHKYPQLILPAPHKHAHMVASPAPSLPPDSPESSSSAHPHQVPTPPPPPPPPPSRLEDMKVSDLKAELKRRNLPVSGAKPHLIERLRPFISDSGVSSASDESRDRTSDTSDGLGRMMRSPVTSPESQTEAMDSESQPPTPRPPEAVTPTGDDIVRDQQKKIEELQRELHKSQLQLQQIRAQAQQGGNRQEPPQDARNSRKLALHHLQAKIQTHQLALHIQQLQTLQAMQGKSTAAAEKRQQEHREFQRRHSPGPVLPPPPPAVAVSPEPLRYVLSPKPNQDRLLQLIATQTGSDGLKMFTLKDGLEGLNGLNGINGKKNVGLVLNGVKVVPVTILPSNPPPQYEEVTRNKPPPPPPLPPCEPTPPPPAVQSQTVDDVLEILIKNGELPASAAQIPHLNNQDAINQNTRFLSESGMVSDDMNSQVHSDISDRGDLQSNLEEIINLNRIDDSLDGHHDVVHHYVNHNSPHGEILNHNGMDNQSTGETINQYQMDKMGQNVILHHQTNFHQELLNGGSPGDQIDENSILDDLINENSMDSMRHDIGDTLMSHDRDADYGPLSVLSDENHLSPPKQDSVADQQHLFGDEEMAEDHHHNVSPYIGMTNDHAPHSVMNDMYKSEMISEDCSQKGVGVLESADRDHGRMDEGFSLERLLGEEAHDGLDLKELGLDLEGLESMDFGQADCSGTNQQSGAGEAMDMDEWLDSLWSHAVPQCDPLLGGPPRAPRNAPPPRPPPHLSWDKLDFAAT